MSGGGGGKGRTLKVEEIKKLMRCVLGAIHVLPCISTMSRARRVKCVLQRVQKYTALNNYEGASQLLILHYGMQPAGRQVRERGVQHVRSICLAGTPPTSSLLTTHRCGRDSIVSYLRTSLLKKREICSRVASSQHAFVQSTSLLLN